MQGCASLHNAMSAHGPDLTSFEARRGRTETALSRREPRLHVRDAPAIRPTRLPWKTTSCSANTMHAGTISRTISGAREKPSSTIDSRRRHARAGSRSANARLSRISVAGPSLRGVPLDRGPARGSALALEIGSLTSAARRNGNFRRRLRQRRCKPWEMPHVQCLMAWGRGAGAASRGAADGSAAIAMQTRLLEQHRVAITPMMRRSSGSC